MTESVGYTCQLCGNQFPDDDAIWNHECPAWADEVRRVQPRLAVYRNIDEWYRSTFETEPWRRRLVNWSLRQMFPDKPNPDLLDGLGKLGPKFSRRLEAKLVRLGKVDSRERTPAERARRRLELDENEEERQMMLIVRESKRRRRER